MQLEKVSLEQRESMNGIRAALESTMKIVQTLQQHNDLQVVFLSLTWVSLLYVTTHLCNLCADMGSLIGNDYMYGCFRDKAVYQ